MLERLSENNARVRNAELRLMLQRSFIERLEAARRDTISAEESREVMRNLLGELYQERTALRRHLASQSQQSGALGKDEAPRRGTKEKSPRLGGFLQGAVARWRGAHRHASLHLEVLARQSQPDSRRPRTE
jgi:hypothetical protein